MLVPSRYLNHLVGFKSCNLEWLECLLAFIWIETALSMLVVPTTNYIIRTRQEQYMFITSTNLYKVILKYIESFYFAWKVRNFNWLILSKLTHSVVTPWINFICSLYLGRFINTFLISTHYSICKVATTCYLLHFKQSQTFD